MSRWWWPLCHLLVPSIPSPVPLSAPQGIPYLKDLQSRTNNSSLWRTEFNRPRGVIWQKSQMGKMGSGPGTPFGLEDKAPLNLLDVSFLWIHRLSTSPQTRNSRFGHNTGFPWWLLLFFQENFEAKGDLYKKILKSEKIVRNYRAVDHLKHNLFLNVPSLHENIED